MAACSVAPRPSPNEKSRPAAARVVAFMCGGVRHAALSWKRPEPWATQVGEPDLRIKKPISGRPEIGAQFQLWIFSYHVFGRSPNASVSRVLLVGLVRNSIGAQRLEPGW